MDELEIFGGEQDSWLDEEAQVQDDLALLNSFIVD